MASDQSKEEVDPEILDILDSLRDLALTMISALVDHPEDVTFKYTPMSHNGLMEVYTRPEEFGQAIGKEGQNVSAIRKILSAAATKQNVKFHVEIVPPRRTP